MDSQLEAILYDCENELTLERQNLDIAFYLSFLNRSNFVHAKVLEYGCGTGRISIPLAAADHTVTGVDVSLGRLSVASSKTPPSLPVTYMLGDMARYAGQTDYDLVIVPYSSFLILENEARRLSCLSNIARSMRPGGRAIIDNSPNFSLHQERTHAYAFSGFCKRLRADVICYETVRQDRERDITYFRKDFEIRTEEGTRIETHVEEDWHTLTPKYMLDLIDQSPLRCEEIFGTYQMDPLFRDGHMAPGSYKNIYVLSALDQTGLNQTGGDNL